jgi:hypothetical protein
MMRWEAENRGGRMAGGELVSLAGTAGQAVVTAAATDAWGTLRAGIARLLGRGDRDTTAAVERRLDDTGRELAETAQADLVVAQARVAAAWQARLADLLEDDPQAVAPLQVLLDQVRAMLPAGPVSASGHGVAAGRDVTITASDGGVAAGTIHGDVSPPGPTVPGPAA